MWLPDDAPSLSPIQIFADGNCLPRCASVLAYEHENCHDEMRIRIVLELAGNLELYLNNDILQRGFSPSPDNLPKQYAMYSEHYMGDTLTAATIRSVLCKEIESIVKSGAYMGIWQIHALASIFNCKLLSIYPKYGGATVRQHLHRWVVPCSKLDETTPTCRSAIMWSSTHGKNQKANQWRVNHFVLCVP